jgi:antitoxin VapB
MPLSIKDPTAEQLARALAERTGETITEAVIKALRERLEHEQRKEQTVESLVGRAFLRTAGKRSVKPSRFERMRGTATSGLTTDQIMALSRGVV